MNRTYFAGNYYVGNNGVGRTNLVTSPTPIGGTWANYFTSAKIAYKDWFLIDTTGKVFFLGYDATVLGVGGTNQCISCTVPTSIARPGSYSNVAFAASNTAAFLDGSNGSIWTTGIASSGQLGNNTTTPVSSPVSISRSSSYSKLASSRGPGTFWAIDGATGTVFGWGSNTLGQLGDNTKANKSSPVSVARPGSYKDVAGYSHVLLIDAATGNIWASGYNVSGQLGNNTINTVSSPVSIARPGSYTAIAAGCAGGFCSFAIDASTGNIWAWGDNAYGLLGNNTMTGTSSPVSIARQASYASVSCCGFSVIAIDASDGSLWAWGANWYGQLGDGTTTNRSSPVSVLGNRSYVSAKAGGDSIYAMTADGTVYVWGYDFANQLGRQVLVYTSTLIPLLNSATFTKIVNNIFLDSAGNAWCTGSDGVGSLGDNATADQSSLVSIARPGSYKDIAATYLPNSDPYVACAAIDGATGNIWTWGQNLGGALGNNTLTNTSSPVSIARSGSYSSIISGGYGTCFIAIEASTGNVYSWGINGYGQLGNNTLTNTSSPVSIARSTSYSAVAAGGMGTVAYIDGATGNIWMTGRNSVGQLGDNTKTGKSSPVSIKRAASYKAVAIADETTYAIDASDGSLWAWGFNNIGQLGDGTVTDKSSPVSVLGGRSYINVIALPYNGILKATGYSASTVFMLDANGIVYALGDNTYGQFGNGTTTGCSSPISLSFVSVQSIQTTFTAGIFLTINAVAPIVDTQPSNTEKTQGQTATFTVVAHGNPAL